MDEVADGVFEIQILFVHAHLVVVDDGVVLVDTGLPGRSAHIDQALREVRAAIGNVRTILLTHWHGDHTGNAADLRQDGQFSVPGFTAIHTPGHTAGHVSFLLDRGAGVLFTGDAAVGGRRRVRHPPRVMTADTVAARASVARLAEEHFDVAVFGH